MGCCVSSVYVPFAPSSRIRGPEILFSSPNPSPVPSSSGSSDGKTGTLKENDCWNYWDDAKLKDLKEYCEAKVNLPGGEFSHSTSVSAEVRVWLLEILGKLADYAPSECPTLLMLQAYLDDPNEGRNVDLEGRVRALKAILKVSDFGLAFFVCFVVKAQAPSFSIAPFPLLRQAGAAITQDERREVAVRLAAPLILKLKGARPSFPPSLAHAR